MAKDSDFFWLGGQELRVLNEEFGRPMVASQRTWEPRIDLIEEEDRVVLKAELPGISPETIELSLDQQNHIVTIRGERHDNLGSEQKIVGVYQLEILYGDFERRVPLPPISIEQSEMKAIFRHGILILLMPKQKSESKSITIENQDV